MAREHSEWGRLNAGQVYGILAVDIDRALANAGLSEHEQSLVQAVRERSWGTSARRKERGKPWPDAEPARLDLQKLAEDLGVPFQRLYEARRRLLTARILTTVGGGLMVNKNAHEWLDARGQTPRLSPAKLAYAASSRSRNRNNPHPPEFTVEREDDSRLNVNAIHGQTLKPFTVEREENSRLGVNDDSRLNVNGHIEERARHSDSQKREIPEDAPSERTQTAGAGVPETGDDLEPFEAPGLDLPPRIQPSGADSAAARELEAWASGLGADRSGEPYAGWARAMCDLVPAAWVRRLLERRVLGRQGAGRASLPLCARILADWQAAGQCEYETASGPAVNGAAPPSTNGPALPRSRQRAKELHDSFEAFDFSRYLPKDGGDS
jgi:hypothetical protein